MLVLVRWVNAIQVPFTLIFAQNWSWVIFADVLLVVSQDLTWSSTVVIKIDLLGEKDRALAMGINEFAEYFAVGTVALFTGFIGNHYGITLYPFYIGILISIFGFVLTAFGVKDTRLICIQRNRYSHCSSPLQFISRNGD